MKLLVGLGNPGKKYEKSRHNLGFVVLDGLLQELTRVEKTTWKMDKKSNGLVAKVGELILVKPQTMMNASGYAIKKLLDFYHAEPAEVWVVHDDVDLPLGKIKIRKGGAAAGHHGVESVIERLGTADFVRFRLGIGKPVKRGKWEVGGGKLVDKNVMHREVEKYVLSGFGGKEAVEAERMIKKAVATIKFALEKGLEEAMNQFNQ